MYDSPRIEKHWERTVGKSAGTFGVPGALMT